MQVTIQDIKDKLVEPMLKNLPYRFNVLTDTGEYAKERMNGVMQEGTITSLVSLSASEVSMLSGALKAVAMNVTLSFLIPVGDDTLEQTYSFVELFRSNLEAVFGLGQKLKIEKDGKSYVGAASYGLPMGGELLQRQGIGSSFEYICYMQFSYLEDAVNSSDVIIKLNEEQIPYASFSFARKNTVSAALTATENDTNNNGEASGYAESSAFALDLSCPLLAWNENSKLKAITDFLTGTAKANDCYKITIQTGEQTIERYMIFSEVRTDGAGIENATLKISLIPYMVAEDEEQDEET